MVRGAADQSVVDDGVDKERKKKNRRSNRRSNRNASVSVSGSASTSISEIHGEAMQTLRNGNKTSFVSHSSSRQQGLDLHPSNNQESTKASDVTFCSMPTMHINEPDSVETSSMHHLLPADLVGEVVSESCPTMTAHDGWEYINEEGYAQSPIFLPHLSREAVNEALEKGYALRALFHVNAHNQLEAYCKIDGVQTDVLISGIAAQNRAVLLSEAKVLGLGPRFMSIYIHKLAIERRIYYDEVEGLKVEWLEATSTLVLNLGTYKRSCRRGGLANYRLLEDVALVTRPYDQKEEQSMSGGSANECIATNVGVAGSSCPCLDPTSNCGFDPGVFPMTVHLLSTIPVALHAVGGDDGPLDIGVRLYMSTYLG